MRAPHPACQHAHEQCPTGDAGPPSGTSLAVPIVNRIPSPPYQISATSAPPSYKTSPPPSYVPAARPTETALLLGPRVHVRRCARCMRDVEARSSCDCDESRLTWWALALLIALNTVLWSVIAVLYVLDAVRGARDVCADPGQPCGGWPPTWQPVYWPPLRR